MQCAAGKAGTVPFARLDQGLLASADQTIDQLFKGAEIEMPPTAQTFKLAPKAAAGSEDQAKLEL
jgi:hypothetical protein